MLSTSYIGQQEGLPDGYEVLLENAGPFDILFRSQARAELRTGATAEQRAGLEELVVKFVKHGPSGLPLKKWNGAVGWFPSQKSRRKVCLQALRPWTLTAYGFCCEFRGRPTFIITGVDPTHLRDNADQILAEAGEEAFRVSGQLK